MGAAVKPPWLPALAAAAAAAVVAAAPPAAAAAAAAAAAEAGLVNELSWLMMLP
jgi:hypothetical protein